MAGRFQRIVEIRKRRESQLQRQLNATREERDERRAELENAQTRVRAQERGLNDYWAGLVQGLASGMDLSAFQAGVAFRDVLQAQLVQSEQQVPAHEAALEKAEIKLEGTTRALRFANRARRKMEEQREREVQSEALQGEVLSETEDEEFLETRAIKRPA